MAGTHLIVCKTAEALDYLKDECYLLWLRAEKSKPVTQGDALVARDILEEKGFKWGVDFYLKKQIE